MTSNSAVRARWYHPRMMTDSALPFDPYALIGEFYDLEHAAFDEDVACLMNFVQAVGDPVLELGCGSGRFLLPIAAEGFRVTGLDRSQPMLARAREAAEAEGVSALVSLHEGEMTAADQAPGGPFGVVLASLNSLLHLDTPEAQRAALASARRALDPRGQLLIDILNPTPETLRGLDGALVHEGGWAREDGSRVDKFSARRVDVSEQTILTDLWYDLTATDGTLRRVATRYRMRYLHRAELELLLELAGFAAWEFYGSYDLDPFDAHSDRMIVAAEAS